MKKVESREELKKSIDRNDWWIMFFMVGTLVSLGVSILALVAYLLGIAFGWWTD